ncbi:Superoxide dismutase [Cu-Zn] [Orchesella cincta]|uniref:Superoxide dismutase [Cu-Zn] n=1 Tax=Orchesella cincta TaxID=48709 RepID=A0A1D2MEJ4_ORCCI|nr:Superoxide dismutase [Cu-Zn] [Orchesella cincta]
MAGTVHFQTLNDQDGLTTSIYSDLFHVNQDRPAASDHAWKLYITDYNSNTRDDGDCQTLQLLWDPDNRQTNGYCTKTDSESCAAGEMTEKHGKIRVGARQSVFSRKIYKDATLPPVPYGGRRKIFVVIFHPDKPDTIVGCARIQKIEPKKGTALVQGSGSKVNFTFVQNSPFHPTTTFITARNLNSRGGAFHVHLFPKMPKSRPGEPVCSKTGGHWNPYQVNVANYPNPASGTDDQFELGDLSGKYGTLAGLDNVTSKYLDQNLPLYGPNSILGRSVVVYKDGDGGRWICGNIENTKPLVVAMARFKYPLVGTVYFTQEANNPFAETSIFVDGLHYSDGSKNNTLDHEWAIHSGEINKDYYDWRNRCQSAGNHFNPYRVSIESRGYSDCGPSSPFRCELGDASTRTQRLTVAGTKNSIFHTRRFFTDMNLPLSGRWSIVGRSVVITDEVHPVHRGNRLACVKIQRVYRIKVVAKDWFPNGKKIGITGKFEFIQETPFSPVKSHVMLKGLEGTVNNYHVHQTSIPIHQTTPCSDHSVGGHFNPFNITRSPAKGTPDQYEVGDLSGKFDKLRNLHEFEKFYNDTNLELIAPHSIIGRSIVIHKSDRNLRYACADLVRGYSPSEAAEYRAIASFHHPDGYVWGYVRFTQLVYNDGSLSDTSIEVNLKYPGQINRNATRKHGWSVWVNRIGHDAAVKSLAHRCVAAGYRWNPFFVHLADPNNVEFYAQECSPETPLRCEVGDITGRLGSINLGENKYVKIDPNLPLSGPGSVLGRSLIIHAPNGGVERLACANIDPDKDIIKYANIRKTNDFLIEDFIDEVRKVLGVPDWLLTFDNRQTKDVYNGECIQVLFHFRGPEANRIEQDFDKLLNGREIGRPSIDIPGVVNPPKRKTKLPYRTCSSRRPSQQLNNQLGIDTPTRVSSGPQQQSSLWTTVFSSLFTTLLPLISSRFVVRLF